MTPAEREELLELHESFWPPFDLEKIEAELAGLVEMHGDSVTADDLKVLERVAA